MVYGLASTAGHDYKPMKTSISLSLIVPNSSYTKDPTGSTDVGSEWGVVPELLEPYTHGLFAAQLSSHEDPEGPSTLNHKTPNFSTLPNPKP